MNKFLVVLVFQLSLASCTPGQGAEPGDSEARGHEAEQAEAPHDDLVQEDLSNQEREKRSLGFVASLFNRVKCDLQLERKSCTIRETETICKNYFEPKCF